MFKIVVLVFGAAIAVILVYAALRRSGFTLQRSAVIVAPPERIFALINDLKAFNTWNPFATEPGLKLHYESVTQGQGAAYAWAGTKSGIGTMAVTESVPAQRVAMKLDFSKPMEAHNTVLFSLIPQGTGTQVTWAMSGNMPYAHRLMTIFFSMDKMVGSQFELGLASLKSLAEKPQ
jgi:uncharacterized protein YndB with AHSA1/START domain